MPGSSAAAWLWALSVLPVAAAPAPEARPVPTTTTVVLEWSAPDRCPAASAVQERLTRTLAGSAADPRGLRARASVSDDEEGVLTLVLELERDDGPVGRRTLRASDCDALATAAVLIVALAIDPEAKLEEPEETPPAGSEVPEPSEGGEVPLAPDGSEASTSAAPGSSETETSASHTSRTNDITAEATELEPRPRAAAREPPASERAPARSPRPLRAGLRLGAGAGVSVLADASALVSVAAATWGRAFRVELGATYWTPVEVRPAGSTAGGRLQQWTIDARGCGLVRPGPLELPLCGGLDVGAVHGVGVGVTSPRQATSLRLAFTAGAALVWRPARWKQRVGPWIGADLLVALVRARFRATPASPGLVHHTPPVGGRVAAGIEVRFR